MATLRDEDAFHEFVVARTAALARTAYLLTGDHHLAEDLVQTALFKAAKSWGRIQGDPEPYVRRILYTENVSWWLLVLRYYEDRTETQTAELLGIGVGTVKSTTRQALARLRAVAPHLGDLVGVTR